MDFHPQSKIATTASDSRPCPVDCTVQSHHAAADKTTAPEEAFASLRRGSFIGWL